MTFPNFVNGNGNGNLYSQLLGMGTGMENLFPIFGNGNGRPVFLGMGTPAHLCFLVTLRNRMVHTVMVYTNTWLIAKERRMLNITPLGLSVFRQIWTRAVGCRQYIEPKQLFFVYHDLIQLVVLFGPEHLSNTALWGSCNGEIRIGICHFWAHFKQKWHFHFLTRRVLLNSPL